MRSNTLFLTLKVFSATGGIEKVCRIAGKALNEINLQAGGRTKIYCMHDRQQDAAGNLYFPQEIFTGFGANKINFVYQAVKEAKETRLVIISHINLLLVGWLIKKLYPNVKLVMLAHGIEVWEPLGGFKKKMLALCDQILPVSEFTKNKMISLYALAPEKFTVLNNCLDPHLPIVINTGKSPALLSRYGLNADNKILLTLTRLATGERYKGYDHVLEALEGLVAEQPNLRYMIAGKYDAAEKKRLDTLIAKKNLQAIVVFAGFVPEEELAPHFRLADSYVMPSTKEGFGIVFIEAMYYGIPVIAGNKDGSVDALANGAFGLLIDPDDRTALTVAIKNILQNPQQFVPDRQQLEARFGYRVYKENVKKIMADVESGSCSTAKAKAKAKA